jgi:phytanoyl-CoA hydroxylase
MSNMSSQPVAVDVANSLREYAPYRVSVDEYVTFRSQGFLIVRGLVDQQDVHELLDHTGDIMYGRVRAPGLEPPPPDASREEIEKRYLRIHMLHRVLPIHEKYMLHPRVLDVVQALVGPDVLAMQTMLFLKPPGGAGQGYHQDSFYIPTIPDTLIGAWIALDDADEENGCLWVRDGSQHEPIYPDTAHAGINHGDTLRNLPIVTGQSHTDTKENGLTPIANRYQEVPAVVQSGDVVFFGGHVIHRSHRNRSQTRFRRSFVSHYSNARSYTEWNYGDAGGPGNHFHILARGSTHLPYAMPKYGTPCAATRQRVIPASQRPGAMMPDEKGNMAIVVQLPGTEEE